MKKICVVFLPMILSGPAVGAENIMFGLNDKNAISIYLSHGTGSGSLLKLVNPFEWDVVPMNMIMVGYSQPIQILRLPGRVNVNAMQNIAYNSARGLSFFGLGISWDVALFNWRGFYIGAGIGPYYRDNHDRWVSSRIVFGEKFFIGKKITNNLRTEFFTIHFSNGDLTETNYGFNFAGIAMNYSF